jgi:hypothetical protein
MSIINTVTGSDMLIVFWLNSLTVDAFQGLVSKAMNGVNTLLNSMNPNIATAANFVPGLLNTALTKLQNNDLYKLTKIPIPYNFSGDNFVFSDIKKSASVQLKKYNEKNGDYEEQKTLSTPYNYSLSLDLIAEKDNVFANLLNFYFDLLWTKSANSYTIDFFSSNTALQDLRINNFSATEDNNSNQLTMSLTLVRVNDSAGANKIKADDRYNRLGGGR